MSESKKKTTRAKSEKKLKLHHKIKRSFYNRHPFVVPLLTLAFLFVGSIMAFLIFGGVSVKPADTKIIHYHSENQNMTVPTRAATVKDFLDHINVKVGEGDIVEPALSSPITGDQFSINLYKAKLVTVVDDSGKKIVTKSAESSPAVVASELGYKLYPEDKVEVSPPSDALKDGVIGTQIKIEKASPVKLVLFGTPYEIRTQAKTVAELAKERNFQYDEKSVLPAPSTKITDNMAVFVTEPGKQLATGEEIIPRGQDTVLDENLDLGKTQVKNDGADGKKAIIYEVQPNGSKKYLQEVIISAPVNRIIAKGKKAVTVAPNVNVSGDKASLMAAAGISGSDYGYVDYIVGRESGWRPGAGNASSGAYGLCQALPASKMSTAGGDYLTNPVTQLRWCSSYATRAYGSWSGAYAFWLSHRWW